MSVDELFWAGQSVYLEDIFLPVIIGVLVFVPVLVILFVYGFGRRYLLWKRGQPDGEWSTGPLPRFPRSERPVPEWRRQRPAPLSGNGPPHA